MKNSESFSGEIGSSTLRLLARIYRQNDLPQNKNFVPFMGIKQNFPALHVAEIAKRALGLGIRTGTTGTVYPNLIYQIFKPDREAEPPQEYPAQHGEKSAQHGEKTSTERRTYAVHDGYINVRGGF